MNNTKNEMAQKAEAEAKVARAKADAAKAEAELAERYAESDAERKTAWETYEQAEQEAGVAELTAKQKRQEAARAETESALTEALRVRVRDYLLIDDIATQAARVPSEITFATLVDEAERLQYKGRERDEAIAAAVGQLDEQIHEATGYYLDTEPREKIYNRISWLYEQAEMDETRLGCCIPAEA